MKTGVPKHKTVSRGVRLLMPDMFMHRMGRTVIWLAANILQIARLTSAALKCKVKSYSEEEKGWSSSKSYKSRETKA